VWRIGNEVRFPRQIPKKIEFAGLERATQPVGEPLGDAGPAGRYAPDVGLEPREVLLDFDQKRVGEDRESWQS
jgi:hypothetical protein